MWLFQKDDPVGLSHVLDVWLNELRDCGVDFYEYGKREEELHEAGLVSRCWGLYPGCDYYTYLPYRFASFSYGSSPSDWAVYLEDLPVTPKDIEDVEVEGMNEMPGGWVDDEDQDSIL